MSLLKITPDYLERILFPYLGNPLILDTGPLTLFLIGLCDPSKQSSNDIWQGHTREELNLLLSIIKRFKILIITPQILAECTNLLNRFPPGKYQFLLNRIIKPLKEFGEVYIEKDIILNCPSFSIIGSTDTGIIECSKKENSLIITQDSGFKEYCDYNRVPCLNFNALRPSVWDKD
ncbi:MAG TPA: hypothetical protein VJH95_03205 [Candidatus Nanoarchaeia archaeon]|nr:hypothetical protein [Candidatus Nanoarchaeia archaeon]